MFYLNAALGVLLPAGQECSCVCAFCSVRVWVYVFQWRDLIDLSRSSSCQALDSQIQALAPPDLSAARRWMSEPHLLTEQA